MYIVWLYINNNCYVKYIMFYNTIYMNNFYLCRLLFLANIGYFWWPWMCLCLSVSKLALNMFILCCAMSRLAQSSLSLSLSSLVTHTHTDLFSLEEKLQGNGDAETYSNRSAHSRQNCNQRFGQMSLGSPNYHDYFLV